MKNPQSVFDEYLARNRMKATSQRRSILAVFLQAKGHFSSEEFYGMVKQEDPSVGQATVYRTLRHLSASGVASEVKFGDGVTRYELNDGRGEHDHLICERCGKSVEIHDPEIEKLQSEIADSAGFTLTSRSTCLYGLCEKCRRKKND